MRQSTWKKLLALLMVCVMTMALLAGCGSSNGSQTNDTPTAEPTEAPAEPTEAPAENETPEAPAQGGEEAAPADFSIEYATGFKMQWMDGGVKLFTDANNVDHLLVPKDAEVPAGYDGVDVIRTPVERVYYTSTTDVGLLAELKLDSLYDTIAAVGNDISAWTNPQIIDRMESGKIAYIDSTMAVPNIEEVATLGPDLVLLYPNDTGFETAAQLDEFSIPYIMVSLTNEPTDEGIMEWMKAIAALYNEDALADETFKANVQGMEDLKATAAQIDPENRPVVAYGLNYGGIVYTAGADSRTAQTIEAVGGVYAITDLEGASVQISLEEFVDKCRDADILIYTSLIDYLPDKTAMLEDAYYGDPLMAEFKAFQNDTVYVYATDYYASSAAVTEKLEDWMAMVHPELMENYQLRHFVHLTDAAE